MTTIITEVHNIASASGWYFSNSNAGELNHYEAVLCMALVTAVDKHFHDPLQGGAKIVIGLSSTDIENLIGQEVTTKMQDLLHENEIRSYHDQE